MTNLWRGVLAVVLGVAPAVALAQPSDIKIDNAWSRAAMAGRTGVVYLSITDTGTPDRLTSAASPIAAKAELHELFSEHGVAKMRAVATLPVASGKPVVLAPGGFHIMLMDLKQALKQGDSFPVTLNFERSGSITATVTVRASGGSSMGHDAMGGMHMPGKSP